MAKLWADTLEQHRALVRSRLVNAFLGLVSEQPLEDVTVSAVAERAGLARSAVYNHVDHLHDLALLHTEETIGSWLADLTSDPDVDALDWIERLTHATLRVFADDPLGDVDLAPHLSPDRLTQLRSLLAPITQAIHARIAAGVEAGQLAGGDPTEVTTFVWATLSGYRQVVGRGRADVDETATAVSRLLRRALAP